MSTVNAPDGTAHGAGHYADPGHDDHHAHGHDGLAHHVPHGTLRGYLIGFGLSVVLTAIPFWLVMNGLLASRQATGFIIMAFAVVQIVVHMIYFLHMNAKSDDGWTMVAFVFTLILVVITLAGSVWVMHHLNVNMMPGHHVSQAP